jgi:hypothetical protein
MARSNPDFDAWALIFEPDDRSKDDHLLIKDDHLLIKEIFGLQFIEYIFV